MAFTSLSAVSLLPETSYTGISPKTGTPNLFTRDSPSVTVLFKKSKSKTNATDKIKPKPPPKITFFNTLGEELPPSILDNQ